MLLDTDYCDAYLPPCMLHDGRPRSRRKSRRDTAGLSGLHMRHRPLEHNRAMLRMSPCASMSGANLAAQDAWLQLHSHKPQSEKQAAAATPAQQSAAPQPGPAAVPVWTVHGQQYDLSDFAPIHPGGEFLIRATCGSDVTALFETCHGSSLRRAAALQMLHRYATSTRPSVKHTRTRENDMPAAKDATVKDATAKDATVKDATPLRWSDGLYSELRAVVLEYRLTHGIKATDSLPALLWYAMWFAVQIVSLVLWWRGGGVASTLALGASCFYWSVAAVHDGTHLCLTSNRWLSQLVAWSGACGFSVPNAWVRRHMLAHHVAINDAAIDPDVYAFAVLFRISPEITVPRHWWWALPLASSLTSFGLTHVSGVELMLTNRLEARLPPSVGVDRIELRSQAIFTLLWWVAMIWRASCHGLWSTAAPIGIGGVLFYLASQVSHVQLDASKTPPDTNGGTSQKPLEWAEHQLAECKGDYSYDRAWAGYLSLGLNNQALHHLFPSVHWCHYPALTRKMRPVFAKHGVLMPGYTQNYADSLGSHLRTIVRLNEGKRA